MNKGFTLIELLAVIIVILTLTLLTTISVSNIIKNSKEKLNNAQKKIIEDATGMWMTDNLDKLPDDDSEYTCIYIEFDDLVEYGAIDEVTLKDIDQDMDTMNIRIDYNNNAYQITLDADSVSNCQYAYLED